MSLDFIYKRRSVRKFKPDPVSDEIILELLKAAMAAPSGRNKQPWQFIVVKDEKKRNEITKYHRYAQMAKESPVVIAVLGKRDEKWHVQDCSAATQNILLAAADLGLGAVWCGMDEERQHGIKELLKVPGEYWIFSIIPVGYPNEFPAPRTQYSSDKVHWETF